MDDKDRNNASHGSPKNLDREAKPAHENIRIQILRGKDHRGSRKELADASSVPPYVIFPDRTLLEMAARCPTNLAALMRIHGVGRVKLARYGEIFLQVIRQYSQEHRPPHR